MSRQFRGQVKARQDTGGGQRGQASLYQIQLSDGRIFHCDYVEIASDGFRTLAVGEEVWCSVSLDDPGRATYVVPIRNFSARQLLGLPEPAIEQPDPIAQLWF